MMNKLKALTLFTFIGLAFSTIPALNDYEVKAFNTPTVVVGDGRKPLPAYSSSYKNEPLYSSQQNSRTFKAMNVGRALDTYRGETVKVAILDSGINYNHEEFQYNGEYIFKNTTYTINNSLQVIPYTTSPTLVNDTLGHGTNVAGTIASQINSLGVAGLAPNVELYIYKVTDSDNSYNWEKVKTALNHCVLESQVDIINMSIQSYTVTHEYNGKTYPGYANNATELVDYINSCYNHGILCIAAAGNHNTAYKSYPASNEHCLSIGSLANGSSTEKASYSNLSDIDLVTSGSVYVPLISGNSDYDSNIGTSFSSPLVAAAAALYKQNHKSATPDQIINALKNTCDKIPGNPSWSGSGRLSVSRLLGLDSVTDIELNNVIDESITLEAGGTFDIDYSVIGEGDYDSSVTFENLDEDVLTVDSNGHIIAKGVGEDLVSISSVDNPNVFKTITVTVNAKKTKLSLNRTSLTLKEGETFQLVATVDPIGTQVNFQSSNTFYATVSSSGLVTAKTKGTVTITATANEAIETCEVTINKADLTKIECISTPKPTYYVGDSFSKPTIRATYANNATQTVTNYCQFTGFDLNTAGNYTVTVSYTENNITKETTFNIEVIAVRLESIATAGTFKTSYVEDDTFDATGLKLTLTYNDTRKNKTITSGYVVDTTTKLKKTDTSWTVSYTENGVTKSVDIPITVSEKSDYVQVTSTSDLSTGDRVVIKLGNSGVTGWNSNKDATIDTNEALWVKYLVTEVNGGFTLKDEGANKYIAKPTDNHFLYTTKADDIGTCTTDVDGQLICNNRILRANGSSYRFYSSSSSYQSFVLFKVAVPDVKSVTISPSSLTLDLNGQVSSDLSINVETIKGASDELSWVNSDPTVASLSNGTVTALKVGTTTFTATSVFNNKKSASCTVTVIDTTPIPVTSISLDSSKNIEDGKTTTLTASISPTNATNKNLEWESSNPNVISISGVSGLTATLSALGTVGDTATITATALDGSEVSATCLVTIIERTVLTRIELSNYSSSVIYKDDYDIGNPIVTAYFSNDTSLDVTSSATITSNINTSVIGKQNITASYTFEGVTKTDTKQVMVTNNGASKNVGISKEEYVDANVTYTFNSASWGDSTSSWNSGKAGNQLDSKGIQITTGSSGANATSKSSYTNISKIIVNYCTNASNGAGTIKVKNGSNSEVSQSVTKTGGTSLRDLTFNFSPKQTGTVRLTVTCTTNSIYIDSIQIFYQTVESVSYPATPTDQARAWANYFMNSTKEYCDYDGVNSDVSIIASIWSELGSEYTYMTDDAKDAFFNSDDASINEARELYKIIYGKYSSQLGTNFVKDSDDNPLQLNSFLYGNYGFRYGILIVLISLISLSPISIYLLVRKKNRKYR